MYPRDRFAANLRGARRRAGLTQEELGGRCGVHRSEISALERAEHEPRLGTIVKLASALGVSPASLCTDMAWDEDRQRFEIER